MSSDEMPSVITFGARRIAQQSGIRERYADYADRVDQSESLRSWERRSRNEPGSVPSFFDPLRKELPRPGRICFHPLIRMIRIPQ